MISIAELLFYFIFFFKFFDQRKKRRNEFLPEDREEWNNNNKRECTYVRMFYLSGRFEWDALFVGFMGKTD